MRIPTAAWRRLYSLRLIRRTTFATCSGVAARHDVGGTQLLLDVSLENSVEHVIWRQAVLVSLVGAQLCRRRAADDALRNDAPEAVAVTREPIDERLADVLQPR